MYHEAQWSTLLSRQEHGWICFFSLWRSPGSDCQYKMALSCLQRLSLKLLKLFYYVYMGVLLTCVRVCVWVCVCVCVCARARTCAYSLCWCWRVMEEAEISKILYYSLLLLLFFVLLESALKNKFWRAKGYHFKSNHFSLKKKRKRKEKELLDLEYPWFIIALLNFPNHDKIT